MGQRQLPTAQPPIHVSEFTTLNDQKKEGVSEQMDFEVGVSLAVLHYDNYISGL